MFGYLATYQCCYRDFITIIINYILEIEHIYFINHHFCRDCYTIRHAIK